jgi:hypothetical protein
MKKALFFAFLLMVIAGCTKEKITNIVPPATLEGEWYGRYSGTDKSLQYNWYFKVRADHTMKIASSDTITTSVADSTYFIVPGDSLRCTYTYRNKTGVALGTYTLIGKPNSNFSYISGTWGNGNDAYSGGTFFMGRKQQ